MQSILLYQLADSAFPVGGFAYSYGLESAVKQSFVYDSQSLRAYLTTFSQQIFTFDFAYISSSYQMGLEKDQKALLKISYTYGAMLLNPQIQKAGMVIGRNWLRLCQQLDEYTDLAALETTLSAAGLPCDFTVVFGYSMSLMGFSLSEALHLYYYMMLRDQVSALIRLGVTGPTKSQEELRFFLSSYQAAIEAYRHIDYTQASKSAYLMEIAQLTHERIWSKLFQN